MSSVGEKLRLERERRGVSLDDVAHATRISARYLEALEQDELSELPGSTFNKGFVRAYAEYLALDPEPLVQAYVEEEVTQTLDGRIAERPDVVDELRASIRRRPDVRLFPLNRLLWIAAPLAVLLAVVAVAAWFAVPVADNASRPPPSAAGGSVAADVDARPEENVQAAPEPAAPDETPPRAAERDVKTKSASPTAPADDAPQPATKTSVADAPSTAATARDEDADAPADRPAGRTPAAARAATEPATPAAAGELSQPSASPLVVDAAGVGTGIEARNLVGRKNTFEEGETAFFWTRIVGGAEGDAIRHVWLREGRAVGSVSLPVNGPHWRTFSQRQLPRGSAGSWAAEARDVRGELLARREFLCVRPGSTASGEE